MSTLQLRILVWSGRLCGLMPFAVRYKPVLHARPSAWATLYSLVISCCSVVLITSGSVYYFWFRRTYRARPNTLLIPWVLAWVFGCSRMFCIYLQQLRHRAAMVHWGNEALRIRAMFAVSYGDLHAMDAPFLDRRSRRLLRWKQASMVVQALFIALSLWCSETGEADRGSDVVKVVVVFGTDVVVLVYATLHFAVLLVALQLFRDCNARLVACVREVRGIMLAEEEEKTVIAVKSRADRLAVAAEEVERITLMYGRIHDFALASSALFAKPTVLLLINSFMSLLVAVREQVKFHTNHYHIACSYSCTVWCMTSAS